MPSLSKSTVASIFPSCSASLSLSMLCILVRQGFFWHASVCCHFPSHFAPRLHILSFICGSTVPASLPRACPCQTFPLLDSQPSNCHSSTAATPSLLCPSYSKGRAQHYSLNFRPLHRFEQFFPERCLEHFLFLVGFLATFFRRDPQLHLQS